MQVDKAIRLRRAADPTNGVALYARVVAPRTSSSSRGIRARAPKDLLTSESHFVFRHKNLKSQGRCESIQRKTKKGRKTRYQDGQMWFNKEKLTTAASPIWFWNVVCCLNWRVARCMPNTQSINVIAVGITKDMGWFRKEAKNPSGSAVHTNWGKHIEGWFFLLQDFRYAEAQEICNHRSHNNACHYCKPQFLSFIHSPSHPIMKRLRCQFWVSSKIVGEIIDHLLRIISWLSIVFFSWYSIGKCGSWRNDFISCKFWNFQK